MIEVSHLKRVGQISRPRWIDGPPAKREIEVNYVKDRHLNQAHHLGIFSTWLRIDTTRLAVAEMLGSPKQKEVKTRGSHLPGWMGCYGQSLSGSTARPARRACLTRVMLAATR